MLYNHQGGGGDTVHSPLSSINIRTHASSILSSHLVVAIVIFILDMSKVKTFSSQRNINKFNPSTKKLTEQCSEANYSLFESKKHKFVILL